MPADLTRRLERIQAHFEAKDCLCGDRSAQRAVELVVVEPGWDENRIRQEERSKQLVCPVHGRQKAITLRLAGSDVYG